MSTQAPALESLVCSIVPGARDNRHLRDELVSHCQDILASHIGHSQEPDLGYLADQIKRHLLQSSSSGAAALKFTNLLSRLLEQPVLSRKHASVLFLQSLASSRQPQTSTSFLPSLAPPPPPRHSSTPSPVDPTSRTRAPKGKTKAELLKEYRAKIGLTHLPEALLLRDALYLLQGISGKYVQFSLHDDANLDNTLVFVDDARYVISAPTKALIHRLSEVGCWNDRTKPLSSPAIATY
ncbi:putative gamma-tubulin complex DGRIP91 SPC98 component [Lyophyllum shimeji]|uniref:Gamma-tubulin complex DGRIP91 SPC98 component n=1 Tax=Lyophyllum shimeji TaxID=47721 RepID=A0A9P3PE70_LYOSH|nr:putative gamma-tubulin complex DGRIP91 SPC98 component [Lyophyllum shimeji]